MSTPHLLSYLVGPSDFIAASSLAVLAVFLGLTKTDRVMPMYLRKRQEIALIFAMGCCVRGSEAFGWPTVSSLLHIASAAVDLLAASVTVLRLVRER